MTDKQIICRRCGRFADPETRRRTGNMVFDEHARGKILCQDCTEELEKEQWGADN